MTCLLFVSQLTLTSVAQARNNPTSPHISSASSTSFLGDPVSVWDGFTIPQPTFDFSDDDIVVNVSENVGTGTTVKVVNISLSGVEVTGFGIGEIVAVNDGDNSTACNTDNLSVSWSPGGVTAKGFSCSDLDGIVEFTFTVTDLQGNVTATVAGNYPIESQFRTGNNRSNKETAWIVDPTDLANIVISSIPT